jgi:hypothetical protein
LEPVYGLPHVRPITAPISHAEQRWGIAAVALHNFETRQAFDDPLVGVPPVPEETDPGVRDRGEPVPRQENDVLVGAGIKGPCLVCGRLGDEAISDLKDASPSNVRKD